MQVFQCFIDLSAQYAQRFAFFKTTFRISLAILLTSVGGSIALVPAADAAPARNRQSANIRLIAAPPGSPLRVAILGALRPHVEQDMGEPVRFVVSGLRTDGTYAHVSFTLVRPNGSAIVDTVPGGRAQVYGSALLGRVGTIWRLDHLSLGAGDVWECEHAGSYPVGLMPPDYSC
jgi:hypothetical protein